MGLRPRSRSISFIFRAKFKKICPLNFSKISHILTNIHGLKPGEKSEFTISDILGQWEVWIDCVNFLALVKYTREHVSAKFIYKITHTLTDIFGTNSTRSSKILILYYVCGSWSNYWSGSPNFWYTNALLSEKVSLRTLR